MKLNDFIAALASLQKSDVNPEVITDEGGVITGVGFEDNMVIIELDYVDAAFSDSEEEISDETITPPVEFKAPDFKM